MDKVYDTFLQNRPITRDTLKQANMSYTDVMEVLFFGELKEAADGTYTLESADGLYDYGCRYAKDKNYYKANLCFKGCLQIDSFHYGANLRMFLEDLTLNRFQSALLSYSMEIPEECRQTLAKIKHQNLYVSPTDDRYKSPKKQNDLRTLIYKQEFYEATHKFAQLKAEEDDTVEMIIIEKLLFKARNLERDKSKMLGQLVDSESYARVIEILTPEKEIHYLSGPRRVLLHMCATMENLKKGIIPKPIGKESDSVFTSILHNRFERARHLNTKYAIATHRPKKYDTFRPLLNRIIETKMKLTGTYDCETEAKRDCLKKFLLALRTDDLENAKVLLSEYLILTGLEDYDYLLGNLFRLSILAGDKTYARMIIALADLLTGDFAFDVDEFVAAIEDYLDTNHLHEASILIETLSTATLREHVDLTKDETCRVLNELKFSLSLARTLPKM